MRNRLTNQDPDPGGKFNVDLYGSGSATLVNRTIPYHIVGTATVSAKEILVTIILVQIIKPEPMPVCLPKGTFLVSYDGV